MPGGADRDSRTRPASRTGNCLSLSPHPGPGGRPDRQRWRRTDQGRCGRVERVIDRDHPRVLNDLSHAGDQSLSAVNLRRSIPDTERQPDSSELCSVSVGRSSCGTPPAEGVRAQHCDDEGWLPTPSCVGWRPPAGPIGMVLDKVAPGGPSTYAMDSFRCGHVGAIHRVGARSGN